MPHYPVPALQGLFSDAQCLLTADTIARAQHQHSGAIRWFAQGHTDPWDHVQCAMALSATGHHETAARAYGWLRDTQRSDGSWAIRYDDNGVVDPHTDANFCAYVATGVWHHWLITQDRDFLTSMWPTVVAGIEAALRHQRPDGAVAWASTDRGPEPDALLSSNASIQLSLRCAVALAEVQEEVRPDWELEAGRIGHAVLAHPELFLAKETHAMDWYYPVLTGLLGAEAGGAHIDRRWEEFVTEGLGVRCVSDQPWVTGAETCELVLALDALGRDADAHAQFAAMQHLRDTSGGYWTGLVYSDDKRWPVERTTWTGATVILAADALTRSTPGNGVFRGEGLLPFRESAPEGCPCTTRV
ncbi:MAG: prenyltransferase [Nocardioidaceae bacterium]|nr:prenyltransferase [Nocardioidaceae bacterium]